MSAEDFAAISTVIDADLASADAEVAAAARPTGVKVTFAPDPKADAEAMGLAAEPAPEPPAPESDPPTEADIAAALDAMGLQPSDDDEDSTAMKPPARRATIGTNLAIRGLPSDFAAIEREYTENASRPTPDTTSGVSATVMSDSQIDNLLAALGEDTGPRYSWTTPGNTYGYGHATYGHQAYGRQAHTHAPYRPPQARARDEADTQDRLSAIQDTLGDLETNLASADGMITEVATSVDSVTEEVQVLKETTAEGMSSMRSDIQMLAAQVSSLHDILSEIKAKIDEMADAGEQ
jgi:hypothetical protein